MGPSAASLLCASLLLLAGFSSARDLPSTLRSPVDDPRQGGRCRGRYKMDFTNQAQAANSVVNITNWNGDPNCADFVLEFYNGNYQITPEGLRMNLNRATKPNMFGRIGGQETAISFSRWWQYGKACVTFKAGRGGGIISAFMVDSYTPGATVDDEIDIELTGVELFRFESVWFSLNKLDHSNGGMHYFDGNAFENHHEYCIVRSPDAIYWTLNGDTKRGVFKKDLGDRFPARTGKIVLTIWDAGVSEEGTIEWSGGPTDWSKDVNPDYRMIIKDFTVECADEKGFVADEVIPFANSKAPTCQFYQAPEGVSSASATATSAAPAAASSSLAMTSSAAASATSLVAASTTTLVASSIVSSATALATTESSTSLLTTSTLTVVTPTSTAAAQTASLAALSSKPSAGSPTFRASWSAIGLIMSVILVICTLH